MAAVPVPPSEPKRSTRSVRAPVRPEARAAITPAMPPPTTSTSTSRATGISRAGSITRPDVLTSAAIAHSPRRASHSGKRLSAPAEGAATGINSEKLVATLFLAGYAGARPQPGAGELCSGKAVIPAGSPIAERVRRMGQQVTVREPVQRARGQQTLDLCIARL